MNKARQLFQKLSINEAAMEGSAKQAIFAILQQYKSGEMKEDEVMEALADILQHHDVTISQVHDVMNDMNPSEKSEALSPKAKRNIKRGALGAAAIGAGALGYHYGVHHMLAHAIMSHPFVHGGSPDITDNAPMKRSEEE